MHSGRRTPIVATVWSEAEHSRPIGAAIVGRGELDLVIDPLFRGKGYGSVALRGLLATARGNLTAWSHGDHPAARVLADHHGFLPVRRLLQLRSGPLSASADSTGRAPHARQRDGVTIEPFRDGDEDEWVELNARIFESHPEQGRLTVDDLRTRQAEPWYEPKDFLVARDQHGRIVGYDWVKVEPDAGGSARSTCSASTQRTPGGERGGHSCCRARATGRARAHDRNGLCRGRQRVGGAPVPSARLHRAHGRRPVPAQDRFRRSVFHPLTLRATTACTPVQ